MACGNGCQTCTCPPGLTGASGLTGAPGTVGAQGLVGTPGTNGTNGTNGISVANVVQTNATTAHFLLSDGSSTSNITLPAGPQGNVGLPGPTVAITSPNGTISVGGTAGNPQLDVNWTDPDTIEGVQDVVGALVTPTGLLAYNDGLGSLSLPAGVLGGMVPTVDVGGATVSYQTPQSWGTGLLNSSPTSTTTRFSGGDVFSVNRGGIVTPVVAGSQFYFLDAPSRAYDSRPGASAFAATGGDGGFPNSGAGIFVNKTISVRNGNSTSVVNNTNTTVAAPIGSTGVYLHVTMIYDGITIVGGEALRAYPDNGFSTMHFFNPRPGDSNSVVQADISLKLGPSGNLVFGYTGLGGPHLVIDVVGYWF